MVVLKDAQVHCGTTLPLFFNWNKKKIDKHGPGHEILSPGGFDNLSTKFIMFIKFKWEGVK